MLISDCGIIKNKGTKKNLSVLRDLSGEGMRKENSWPMARDSRFESGDRKSGFGEFV
jgi:hypothetical protein